MSTSNTIIRELQEADIPGAMRLKSAENWNQTEDDWRMLLALDPNLCLVASCDDEVVGTVTATNYNNEIAWIGMMLVDQDFRGLGLGKRLLNSVIEKLSDCQAIKLDATDKGLPLYKKLGFREELFIDRMVTPRLGGISPVEGDHSAMPVTEEDLSKLTKMEHEAFGADRSRLFAKFLEKNGDKAWYSERETKLSGFVFGRSGSNYTQLGPLSAESTKDAQTLILAVLRNYVGKPALLDILQDKKDLKELLVSLGFSMQRSFTRMYLKDRAAPASPQKQFLIAGPELG
ncbi:GNAT family N-acetyltransferase [Persicitalea sp.]|uniref:GNAT family N-acetyltransferase n=1 Tax=Persicitalea sp. TaxID=3100273 RepID=UPI003594020F